MLFSPDYTSEIWLHIEQHIEVHCFDDFNTDPVKRARHLAQKRPLRIIAVIRAVAEDIARLKDDVHLAGEDRRVAIQEIDAKKHTWQTVE